MTKHKAGRSLSELLGPPTPVTENIVPSYNIKLANTDVFAVLRSKGGSGEKHSVKEISKELIKTHHKVIAIVKEEDDPFYSFFTPNCTKLTPELELSIIDAILCKVINNEDDNTIININWEDLNLLNRVLLSIDKNSGDNKKTAVILTVGTASGSAHSLSKQFSLLNTYCDKLYISVNLDVEESFETASITIKANPELHDKIKLICWASYRVWLNLRGNKFLNIILLLKQNYHHLILSPVEYQGLNIKELQCAAVTPAKNLSWRAILVRIKRFFF
ncbi:MAG: hypothetical protein GY928_24470 [Colwellia sp.]|nr:hypothetical protein [Colwellia sp.]